MANGYTQSAVGSAAYVINLPPPPDFTITAAPSSLTVTAGDSGTVTSRPGTHRAIRFICESQLLLHCSIC
jgi:hypothetical protein